MKRRMVNICLLSLLKSVQDISCAGEGRLRP